jgi:cytochrome P450
VRTSADSLLDFGIEPRRNVLGPLFGDGIFTQEGLHWADSKRTLRRQLQHKYYGDLDIFRCAVDDLVHVIRADEDIVDLQPLFFRMTLDTSTRYLIGESVHSLVAPDGSDMRKFADAFDLVSKQATEQMRRYDVRWLGGLRRYRRARGDLHRITDQMLDRNLQAAREGCTESTRHGFLSAVAQDAQDRTALKGQILHLLAAGRDTTASLLSWTL